MTPETFSHLAHFEALYAHSDDPWNVRGAWYEQRKRAVLLASLGRERYRSAFEPGCGNGELSSALAARCERLLCSDGAASAVAAAQRRLHGVADAASCLPTIEQRRLPHEWPTDTRFDLIVISELAYYFDRHGLDQMLGAARDCLEPGGELVMCHYLPAFDDRVLATETAHGLAHALPGLASALQHRDALFLLEVWRRTPPSEVAP